jgi:hypothetical protein
MISLILLPSPLAACMHVLKSIFYTTTLLLEQIDGLFGPQLSSAKQNYAFSFFFWKKKNVIRRIDGLLGASPQTPVVPLRGRFWGPNCLLRSRTTLFASFSGKRRL